MKISLSDFKAFKGVQTFDLKKFTLFTGANSTGKSTLKSWFKILNDYKDAIAVQHMIADFKSDIFDFKSLINTFSKDDSISFSVYSKTNVGEAETKYSFRLKQSRSKELIHKTYGELFNIVIKIDNLDVYEVFEESGQRKAVFHLKNMVRLLEKCNGPILVTKLDINSNRETLWPAIDEEKFAAQLQQLKFLNRKKVSVDSRFVAYALQQAFRRDAGTLVIPLFIVLPQADFETQYDDLPHELIAGLNRLILDLIGVITETSSCSITDNYGFLHDYDDEMFEVTTKKFANVVKKHCGFYIRFLQIKDEAGQVYGYKVQVKRGSAWEYMENLGSGTQKYLKLLLNTAFQKTASLPVFEPIVFYEEPENMLHPNLEISFGQFLMEFFRDSDYKFVIETHSLHLLRTFQLAVAEGKIDQDDVTIYDFSIDPKGSNSIREIKIKRDGSLNGNFHTGFSDLASDMELKIWEIHNNLVKHN